MCLDQGPQRSDAGEARTRGPSVSSQALFNWATALPMWGKFFKSKYIQFSFKTSVKVGALVGTVQGDY